MKRIVIMLASIMALATVVKADDRPVTYDQLPQPAKTFISTYYPAEKVSFATKDDDLIRPDYHVVLANGVKVQFENDGRLEKIEVRNGVVPEGIVPVQIMESVKAHYPDAGVTEYEIGRKTYEIRLSNRLELKYNRNFHVIEIDD